MGFCTRTARRAFPVPSARCPQHRTAAFERQVLPGWGRFSIWSCGRDGKEFFKVQACPLCPPVTPVW